MMLHKCVLAGVWLMNWCLIYSNLILCPVWWKESQCVRSGVRPGHLSSCEACVFQISVKENNYLINHVQEAGCEAILFYRFYWFFHRGLYNGDNHLLYHNVFEMLHRNMTLCYDVHVCTPVYLSANLCIKEKKNEK